MPDADLPETVSAVRAWVQDPQDPAARRATLVRFASARTPFLQRSAVMGLMHLQLMDRLAPEIESGAIPGLRPLMRSLMR